ncbi:protein Hook homolog 2-like [Clytia hemisphaerica]|uniref:protein Hook homolog 2-like n=1 Tax=Clytia hemisphaerica TaxID=252671 RepID=UPI0034D5DB5B
MVMQESPNHYQMTSKFGIFLTLSPTRRYPKRERQLTEKGKKSRIQHLFAERKRLLNRLEKRGKSMMETLALLDQSLIKSRLQQYNETALTFEGTHNELNELLDPHEKAEDQYWFTTVDDQINVVKQSVYDRIQTLNLQEEERSTASSRKSLQSSRSSKSSKSSRSSRSPKSLRSSHSSSSSMFSKLSKSTHSSKSSKKKSGSTSPTWSSPRSRHSQLSDQLLEEEIKRAELLAESKFIEEEYDHAQRTKELKLQRQIALSQQGLMCFVQEPRMKIKLTQVKPSRNHLRHQQSLIHQRLYRQSEDKPCRSHLRRHTLINRRHTYRQSADKSCRSHLRRHTLINQRRNNLQPANKPCRSHLRRHTLINRRHS